MQIYAMVLLQTLPKLFRKLSQRRKFFIQRPNLLELGKPCHWTTIYIFCFKYMGKFYSAHKKDKAYFKNTKVSKI